MADSNDASAPEDAGSGTDGTTAPSMVDPPTASGPAEIAVGDTVPKEHALPAARGHIAVTGGNAAFTLTPPPRTALTATLQKQLVGELTEFLGEEGFCIPTMKAVSHLVVELARYREEGVALYPRFVVCDRIDLIMKQTAGAEWLQLGEGTRDVDTMRKALKRCAPLARDAWIAYVQRKGEDTFVYGLFSNLAGPTAIDFRDSIIRGLVRPQGKDGIVLVSQIGDRVVELVGARGKTLTYHLTGGAADGRRSPLADIESLTSAITCDVDPTRRELTAGFIRATLTDVLRRGHGTLIAIAKPDQDPPELGSDSQALGLPLNVAEAVAAHVRDKAEETSFARLLAYAELIEGMLNTDGITLFRTNATVTHFNWFVRKAESPGAKASEGGARKRAFEALSSLVADGKLAGAFFRSADGGSAFEDGGKKL